MMYIREIKYEEFYLLYKNESARKISVRTGVCESIADTVSDHVWGLEFKKKNLLRVKSGRMKEYVWLNL